jgi:CRP-like cAMP-binding protein
VVLSGEVVVSNDAFGRSVELARHGPGQFAGELNMLTGQRPFLTARAAAGGWVLALTPGQVREVLAREADVADLLLRALIARRRRHVSGAVPGAATSVAARTVVAASGALVRRLPLPNWERLEGSGIYYAATDLEAGLSGSSHVVVLGGGNSAGQAALYLGSC